MKQLVLTFAALLALAAPAAVAADHELWGMAQAARVPGCGAWGAALQPTIPQTLGHPQKRGVDLKPLFVFPFGI